MVFAGDFASAEGAALPFPDGGAAFRYRWQFIEDESFTRWGLDQEIKTAFREAALLMPDDFQVNLRYAESFTIWKNLNGMKRWQPSRPHFPRAL